MYGRQLGRGAFRGGNRNRGGGNRGGRQGWSRGGGRGGGGRGRGRGRGGPRHPPRDQPIEKQIEIVSAGDKTDGSSFLNIAIEGCCHGELDVIYERLRQHEETTGESIDLLLCCGDFESIRNAADLHSLAVSPKYRTLGSFYKYYSGESVAPVLTIFVGGNHEASQPLQELLYGGWVAPRIYYMGAAGVVNYQGLRIAGLSGIYKSHDFEMGHFEVPPYDRSTLRSVYHVRRAQVHQLKSLQPRPRRGAADIMLSHDWPQGVEQFGDVDTLLRRKPFFREEVRTNSLGSPPNWQLMNHLQPAWWFAAHLHVKFEANVRHSVDASAPSVSSTPITGLVPSQVVKASGVSSEPPTTDAAEASEEPSLTTNFLAPESSSSQCNGPDLTEQMTRFLALDKCLPRRSYLSIVRVPVDKKSDDAKLEYDAEWLAILHKTHHWLHTLRRRVEVPDSCEAVTSDELGWIRERFNDDLVIPAETFERTVLAHAAPPVPLPTPLPPPYSRMGNPQTDRLLELLELDHVVTIPYHESVQNATGATQVDGNEIKPEDMEEDDGAVDNMPEKVAADDNEIDLDDDEDDDEDDEDRDVKQVDGSGSAEGGVNKKARLETDTS